MSVEDRHTLSDPRLVPSSELSAALAEEANFFAGSNKSPTNKARKQQQPQDGGGGPIWYVDVYRKGVPEPVETLLISDRTLPPRKNKKGKVIWRLPDEESAKGGRMPNFGSDERRRMLELFKERKKIRKKASMKKLAAGATAGSGGGGGSGSSAAAHEKDNGIDTAAAESASSSASAAAAPATAKDEDDNDTAANGSWSRGRIKTADGGKKQSSRRGKKNKGGKGSTGNKDEPEPPQPQPQPELEAKTEQAPPPPPGFRPPAKERQTAKADDDLGRATARLGLADAHAAGEEEGQATGKDGTAAQSQREQQPDGQADVDGNGRGGMPPPPQPPALPCRYIVIPETDRPPQAQQHQQQHQIPSMAVPAAKAFVDLYYPHVTHGLSADLAMHYTPTAQKSISVGGAHSVVTGREAIAMQIGSLAGTAFVVRGVVSQDGVDGRGAHILVTGLVQMPSPQSSAGGGAGAGVAAAPSVSVTPFAHSISLAPVPVTAGTGGDPYMFQIHNDALSLMSSDLAAAAAATAPPAPAPPSAAAPAVSKPPPGFLG